MNNRAYLRLLTLSIVVTSPVLSASVVDTQRLSIPRLTGLSRFMLGSPPPASASWN
jgi:hypothetical protein